MARYIASVFYVSDNRLFNVDYKLVICNPSVWTFGLSGGLGAIVGL